jgi:hypothetical protein
VPALGRFIEVDPVRIILVATEENLQSTGMSGLPKSLK